MEGIRMALKDRRRAGTKAMVREVVLESEPI